MAYRQSSAARSIASDEEASQDREFAFSETDFRALAGLAYDHAGIVLSDSKRNLVYSRLSRRLRALNLDSFASYRDHLATHEREFEYFINAISTNLTKFFREQHHFDHFRDRVVTPYATSRSAKRLRVWSAGCSTGEEPYTIASVLVREIPDADRRDIRILATDIDTEVLKKADCGHYPLASLDNVPKTYRDALIGSVRGSNFETADKLHSLIRFKQLNLLKPWPFAGPFDAIFCRNVMIYFDAPTKAALINNFAEKIAPGGWLYIGHSESILGTHPKLELVGRTIYRRRL